MAAPLAGPVAESLCGDPRRGAIAAAGGRLGWASLIPLFFAWIAVEDQVRKALDNPIAVYLAKDVLAVAIVLPCLGRARGRVLPDTLAAVLAWMAVLHVLWSFHPKTFNPLVPLVGLKLTFSYVPLVWAGHRFARQGEDLVRLCRWLLYTGTLVAAAGIYQATVDPTFLNPEPTGGLEGAQLRMGRDEVPYATGTFLSPGRYVLFLFFVLAAGMLSQAVEKRLGRRLVDLACLVAVIVGIVTSGTRLGIVGLGVCFALSAALAWQARLRERRLAGAPVRGRPAAVLALVAVLVLAAATAFFPVVGTALDFYWESLFAERGDGLLSRLQYHLDAASPDPRTWLFGNGTGSASFGLNYVGDAPEWIVEGGYGAVIWELGGLGLVAYLLLAGRVSAVYLAAPALDRRRPVTALASTFGAVSLFALWYANILGPVLQQYVVAIFLWFFLGVALGSTGAERVPQRR